MTADAGHRHMLDEPAAINQVADRLVSLVRESLPPVATLFSDEVTRWQVMVGPAMLSRSAGTLASLMRLLPDGHLVDAMVLLRTLYESTVVFAWIALAPEKHVDRWIASCQENELHAHNDWQEAGRALLSEQQLVEYHAHVAKVRRDGGFERSGSGRLPPIMPAVDLMAKKCDDHWGSVVPGWSQNSWAGDLGEVTGWHSSLRGLYRFVYRYGSSVVHSGHRSLDPFVTSDGPRVLVHDENKADSLLPYGLGCYLLGLTIGVAEQEFGWPSYGEAARILSVYDSIFAQGPGSDDAQVTQE
jgi:hypothetical protein